jgi:hypothetical protein
MKKIEGNKGANAPDGLDWSKAVRCKKIVPTHALKLDEPFVVQREEGEFYGEAGDYLVQGKHGDKYPLAADVFDEVYEVIPKLSAAERAMQEAQAEADEAKRGRERAEQQADEIKKQMDDLRADYEQRLQDVSKPKKGV